MGKEAVIMCGRSGELSSDAGILGNSKMAAKVGSGVAQRDFQTYVLNGGHRKLIVDTRCGGWIKSLLFAPRGQAVIYRTIVVPQPAVAQQNCRKPDEVGSDISALARKTGNVMLLRQSPGLLKDAARRKDLTPAEQVAIAKAALKMIIPRDKISVLRVLAENPFFSKRAKTYIIENMDDMLTLMDRSLMSDISEKRALDDNACYGQK